MTFRLIVFISFYDFLQIRLARVIWLPRSASRIRNVTYTQR